MEDPSQLVKYVKHTPKIHRQQVLCELIKQYTASAEGGSKVADVSLPVIQRFHGALLFVDISGFTALSQKLDVESLKNYINDYFSKMLSIVDKWDGDVVKFAGDALYIVWPTSMMPANEFSDEMHSEHSQERSDKFRFNKVAQQQLDKAVRCGLEISTTCGHYEVQLEAAKTPSDSSSSSSFVSRILPVLGFGNNKVSPNNSVETIDGTANVQYLDVRVGVSAGMMAGVDVCCHNRSEYFLIGDPLVLVTMAESQAKAGEVVMCPISHELLHGKSGSHDAQNTELPCGCCSTANGLFCVQKLFAPSSPNKSSIKRRGTKNQANSEALTELNNRLLERTFRDISHLLTLSMNSLKEEFFSMLKAGEGAEEATSLGLGAADSVGGDEEKKFEVFLRDHLAHHFTSWMAQSLMDVVVCHVHEVARSMHTFATDLTTRRKSVYADVVADAMKTVGALFEVDESVEQKTETKSLLDEPISTRIRNKSTKPSERKKSFEVVADGEIRSVVTMFIKVDRFDLQLFVDSLPMTERRNMFLHSELPFLTRTDAERHADQTLLERFQACYAVLCGTIMEHGGQLRQFIVDDKGTVCIGTFGLRGSAAVDNAAIAVAAARRIIEGISALDFSASIGITSGKAYCGLVGSTLRHEYAVMGPSTNLSARLMCKASANGIICDVDIKAHDRTHKYHELQAVNAKGYAKPVMTFRPEFSEISASTKRHGRPSTFRAGRGVPEQKDGSEFPAFKTNLHPALERLMIAATSEFFVVEPKVRGLHPSGMSSAQRLHGRTEEMVEIFKFLFVEDVQNPQQLSYTEKVKMMVVSGPSGSGKTALLLAIEKKLISMSRCDHRQNMFTYLYRANVLTKDIQFGAARAILTKMLRTVHRAMAAKEAKPVRNFDKIRNSQDYSAMIEGLLPQLPAELQEKKSALALMIPMLGEAPDDERKSTYQTCLRIAAALFSIIAKMLRRVIVVLIHDVSMLDEWSFQLLHVMWKECKGVCILTTFNLDDHENMHELEQDNDRDDATVSSVMNHFSRFKGEANFQVLNLSMLSKEATFALAKDSLDMGRDESTSSLQSLMEVYDASGGKPLYVVELIRSLASKGPEADSSGVSGGATRTSISAVPSYRVEESVCLRLDKMHLSLQILLKAAAVACSYRGIFDLDMMRFMLSDNNYFAEEDQGQSLMTNAIKSPQQSKRKRSRPSFTRLTMNSFSAPGPGTLTPQGSFKLPFQATELLPAASVPTMFSIPEAVMELLHIENFVKVKSGGYDDTAEHLSEQAAIDLLRDCTLEFVIPLEQNVISGLIVDEQREYFHERIALYLHGLNVASFSPGSLQEEGFHWEQAGLWNRAMACYGKTVAALRQTAEPVQGIHRGDVLRGALQMFQFMQSEAMSVVGLDHNLANFTDGALGFILGDGKQGRGPIEGHVAARKAIDIAMVVVERDVFALIPACRLHLHLAEHYIKSWESKEDVIHAIQVAIVLAVAAKWYQEEMRSQYAELTGSATHNAQAVPPEVDAFIPDNDLELEDQDLILLLSLCVYCSQLLHVDEPPHPLASSPYHLDRFLESEKFGDETETLQAQILLAMHQLSIHRTQRAVGHVELVLMSYMARPHESSSELVKKFGIDLVPFLLASLSQRCILQADLLDGEKFFAGSLKLISDDTIGDAFSWFVAATSMLASCQLMSNGRAEMLRVLAAQGERSAAAQELSVAHGMGPHLRAVCVLWLTLAGDVHVCVEAAEMAAREQQQARRVEELSRLEPLVASEASGPRAAFLQAQGCSLHRVYAESYLVLFAALKESQLNVRIINSLKLLMQLPTEPAGSNYLNVVHVLVYLGTVAAESSGGVLVAVKERSEQNMHHLMMALSQQSLHFAACTLAEAVLLLPLHPGIREQYVLVSNQAKSRITKRKSLNRPRANSHESVSPVPSMRDNDDDRAWTRHVDRLLLRVASS